MKQKYPEDVEKLYKQMKYEKILWLGGFVKTTLSSALIGGGVTLFLAGITEHPIIIQNPWYQSNIGLAAIIVGILIVYLIDIQRRHYKKKEINVYNEALKEKAKIIAEEMVQKQLQEIEEECTKK